MESRETVLDQVMGCEGGPVEMLDETTAGALAETFKVLADPTRVRIISALAERPLCVHELAAALALTHSAVSHQLAMLREMRLVTFDKDGRHVIYQLDDDHIHDLFRQGLKHIRHRG
jgi:ArsR family transcriptional regulator, lead/cadmium/zinc/bismuth-responsive transcriptional repressor